MVATSPSLCRRILIAIDDGQPAQWAARFGSQLAEQLSARVLLVHVLDPRTASGDESEVEQEDDVRYCRRGKTLLQRTESLFSSSLLIHTDLPTGSPAEQIVVAARLWNADMVVIGSHGRGPLTQLLLGSTAEAVVRQSPCPVVTVAHDPTDNSAGPRVEIKSIEQEIGPSAAAWMAVAPPPGSRHCDWSDGDSSEPKQHRHTLNRPADARSAAGIAEEP